MELDITRYIDDVDCCLLSGSQMEHGHDAGRITWRNSMREAAEHPLLTADQIDEARDYFRDFGAWTDEEIDAWPVAEVQGVTAQEVAARVRELEDYIDDETGEIDWDEYEEDSKQGRVSGMIYRADDGRIYFNMTH